MTIVCEKFCDQVFLFAAYFLKIGWATAEHENFVNLFLDVVSRKQLKDIAFRK